jgi:hypothetical protein
MADTPVVQAAQAPMQPLPLTKPLYELRHPGEFILTEQQGHLSRENAIIASGNGPIVPGQVLGKITASGKYNIYKPAAVDGSQTAAAIAIYGGDSTSADLPVSIIARLAEINGNTLVWDATVNTAPLRATAYASLAGAGVMIVTRGDAVASTVTYPDR